MRSLCRHGGEKYRYDLLISCLHAIEVGMPILMKMCVAGVLAVHCALQTHFDQTVGHVGHGRFPWGSGARIDPQ